MTDRSWETPTKFSLFFCHEFPLYLVLFSRFFFFLFFFHIKWSGHFLYGDGLLFMAMFWYSLSKLCCLHLCGFRGLVFGVFFVYFLDYFFSLRCCTWLRQDCANFSFLRKIATDFLISFFSYFLEHLYFIYYYFSSMTHILTFFFFLQRKEKLTKYTNQSSHGQVYMHL